MSYKRATYLSLVFFIFLAIGYFSLTIGMENTRFSSTLGPDYFPRILAVTLVILCIISWIQTWLKNEGNNEKITIPNLGLILITILLTALFITSWYFFGYFYINLFVFIIVLLQLYRRESFSLKQLFWNSINSICFTATIYGLFGILLNLSL